MIQPVHPAYLADPFVLRHAGLFYAIGTGEDENSGTRSLDNAPLLIPLLRSRNLRDWDDLGRCLLRPPAPGNQVWAPSLARGDDGRFHLYYSIGDPGARLPHRLCVATADVPEGPYLDSGRPLLMPDAESSFLFDTHPFRDDDGQWYLFYSRQFWNTDGAQRPGDGIVARRLRTMTTLDDAEHNILRGHADWQRGGARTRHGVSYDWHVVEGACVVKRLGRYWCFFSGASYQTEHYGVDVAVADHVLGPYRTATLEQPRVLRRIPGRLRGPGHNSVVVGPDGSDHIVFHAWDASMQRRQMHILPLVWSEEGPRIPALEPEDPGEANTPGEQPLSG